ncbi:MAG: hypothetical protein QXP91_11445 [Candidatus Methanomethylicia archaeon]
MNSKAQFIVVASLLIGIIVTSLAVSLYLTSTQYQEFRYKASKEVILNIDKDFKRTLTRILASATNEYNTTADFNPPRAHAYEKLSYWYQALSQSYPDAGLQLDLIVKPRKLQEKKTLPNGVEIPERKVENLIKCYWFYPQSISAIYAELAVNLTSHGLYGYVSEGYAALNVTIYTNTIESKKIKNEWYTSFTFHVEKEYGEPVTTLSKENYNFKDPNTLAGWAISFFNPTVKRWQRINQVDNVTYSAGGNYTITFKSPWSGNIAIFYDNYLILWIRDERGILVEAYSYYHVSYVIRENIDNNKQYHPYQRYVFELKPDGTLIWFGISLENRTNKPLPPIPPTFVKQFRVFTTINGYRDKNYAQAPHQVERWEIDYNFPASGFEAERERFMKHIDKGYENRLVFLVNFTHNPSPNIDDMRQRVNVTWVDDCDTPPPQYYIGIREEGIYRIIDNGGIYKLQLLVQEGYSWAIDWSISIHHNNYHCEYAIHGIGWDPVSGGGAWIPNILPGGNYTVDTGPIRAVCYRRSDRVEDDYPIHGRIIDPGPFSHETVILIPYSVKYATIYFKAKWTQDWTDNRYADFITMISGNSTDQGSSLRVQYWAYLESGASIRSGQYSNTGHQTHRRTSTYSYWGAQYRLGFGQALMFSKEYLNAMNEFENNNDELWIWTSRDYLRRVLDYDARRFEWSGNFTIPKGKTYSFRAAIWVYDGGGYGEPNEYYKMFVEDYKPSIAEALT